eukprot:6491840-Amphidinium_carterae.1
MLSMGHEVPAGVAILEALVIDRSAISKVAPLLKSVPTLQQSLRANACDALVVKLRHSIDDLWEQRESFNDVALLHEFSDLLMSAGILYPLDAAIQKYILDLGAMIKTSSEAKVLNGLMEKCDGLATADIKDPKQYKECLSALADTLQPLTASTSQLQESHQSSLLVTLTRIHAFANTNNLNSPEIQAIVEQSINVGAKLAALLGEKGDDITFIKVAMDVIVSARNIVLVQEKNKQAFGGEAMLQHCLTCQRHALQLEKLAKSPSLATHLCQAKFSSVHKVAHTLIAETSTGLKEAGQEKLKQEVEKLKETNGGMNDGNNWVSMFTGSSWQQLLEHASQTLLNMDMAVFSAKLKHVAEADASEVIAKLTNPAILNCSSVFAHMVFVIHTSTSAVLILLKTPLKSLNLPTNVQALHQYEEIHGAFDLSIDETLVAETKKCLNTAHITQASHTLLDAFHNATDKLNLRAHVRGQVQALRATGLDEKLCLQPLLAEKVKLALALRYEFQGFQHIADRTVPEQQIKILDKENPPQTTQDFKFQVVFPRCHHMAIFCGCLATTCQQSGCANNALLNGFITSFARKEWVLDLERWVVNTPCPSWCTSMAPKMSPKDRNNCHIHVDGSSSGSSIALARVHSLISK